MMITRISQTSAPNFGTTVYSRNNKFNKVADICAQRLTENNDSISIGESNNIHMAKNESRLKSAYKPVDYCSEDGYKDRVLVKFDMAKQSKEEIADIIIGAYQVMKQREPLVKNMRAITENHFQELIDTKKQLNELWIKEQKLENSLYSDKFEKEIDEAQEVLNEETNRLAEENGIDVYTKTGTLAEEIKNTCQNSPEANFSILELTQPDKYFGYSSAFKFDYTNK